MNSPLLQLLVLAGIAVFLILRLKSVLGTRDGFEAPSQQHPTPSSTPSRHDFEVIEGGQDHDITDHVPDKSESADALAQMKRVDPSFAVGEFLGGAKQAYEMILMAFESGQLDDITPFLSEDVFEAFSQGVDARQEQGLHIDAEFIGVRETTLSEAQFDKDSSRAEITMTFV
ncbi:MAG: Tim44/TimA family putative adaptor protein, partial [Pseudomonadota bacterium]